ncbi:MAG: heparinase II/III family protein [Chloroflexota bacterium]|nr:heparinase II/III family protein [Chloroflexota bacterium]
MNAVRRHPRGAAVVASVAAIVLVASAVLWLRQGMLSDLPAYLDHGGPGVIAEANRSLTRTDLLRRLGPRIAEQMPAHNDLWITQAGFNSDAALEAWGTERQISLSTFPAWSVPLHPTWAEDPYHNISWQFYYQSLGWLWAPGRGCAQGDQADCRLVADYVLSWVGASPRSHPPSARSWYDHAVAFRTDALVSLFPKVLAPVLSPAELGSLLRSLELHGQVLDGYLHAPGFIGHNHNLFHALSLYNLATAFPELQNATTWRTDARARMSTLLPEMVQTDEGVSLEQAASYHNLALSLFASADAYLRKHDDGLSPSERMVLAKMTAFGALLLSPTMQLPAIGDTSYGTSSGGSLLGRLASQGISSPIADYVLSRGARGTRPSSALFYPKAGYVIARPNYSAGEAWARDLQLIVDTTPRTKVHGHDDVMSVLLNAEGGPLLVDSGGPYLFGNAAHAAFTGASAHNTVVDLGSPAAHSPATDLVETDDARATVVGASFAVSAGVQARRVVVLVKPDLLLVVDFLRATDRSPHRFGLFYHLPPGSAVVRDRAAGTVTAGPAAMGYRVLSSSPAIATVVTGQEHPLLGWVTPAYAKKVAAPVLRFEQRAATAWYVTVIHPAPAGSAQLPGARVDPDGSGGLRVTVAGRAGVSALHITPDGEVEFAGS